MKKLIGTKIILLFLVLGACTQETGHQEHGKVPNAENNVMMEAMDKSMDGMHRAKSYDNPDAAFAAMMIPHHEGAVDMATQLDTKTGNGELNEFARKVIAAQELEITQMKNFLAQADTTDSDSDTDFHRAMQKTMAPMMEGMHKAKLSGDLSQDFIVLMIPHHQSAVEMAKAYLPYANDGMMKKLAQDIITAQEKEIIWLESKLK
jgi:uncharacterized protein (DUF305 family)